LKETTWAWAAGLIRGSQSAFTVRFASRLLAHKPFEVRFVGNNTLKELRHTSQVQWDFRVVFEPVL